MRYALKLSIVIMLLSSTLYAANPRSGWYAGIFFGGSYSTDIDYLFIRPNGTGVTNLGNMSYSFMGGGGGQIGYKWFPARVELEVLYNYAPYETLTSGPATYTSPDSSTGLRFKGNTSLLAGFINAYYDFYTQGCNSNWAPYIGAGFGYAYMWNTLEWYRNNTEFFSANIEQTQSVPVAQGIVGAAYFIDDYTSFALDYRYVTTGPVNLFNNEQFVAHTLNFTFNGSFNCF
jgi:hypothetical protein